MNLPSSSVVVGILDMGLVGVVHAVVVIVGGIVGGIVGDPKFSDSHINGPLIAPIGIFSPIHLYRGFKNPAKLNAINNISNRKSFLYSSSGISIGKP